MTSFIHIRVAVVFLSAVLLLTNCSQADQTLKEDIKVDKILVEKKARRLTLLASDRAIKSYEISLGGNPEGAKVSEGDNRTPEGIYKIDSKNSSSGYHLALHISYPNSFDVERARQMGVSPGGNIMIHGIKNGFGWVGSLQCLVDWTKGCIAVTNDEIEEIYRIVPVGTPVEIKP